MCIRDSDATARIRADLADSLQPLPKTFGIDLHCSSSFLFRFYEIAVSFLHAYVAVIYEFAAHQRLFYATATAPVFIGKFVALRFGIGISRMVCPRLIHIDYDYICFRTQSKRAFTLSLIHISMRFLPPSFECHSLRFMGCYSIIFACRPCLLSGLSPIHARGRRIAITRTPPCTPGLEFFACLCSHAPVMRPACTQRRPSAGTGQKRAA